MIKKYSIREAINKKKEEVELYGWVHRERGSNKFKFIQLRDSSEIIQCVFVKKNFEEKKWEEIDKILVESSLMVKGKLVEDKRSPIGYEVQVEDFKVYHRSEVFPITKDQSPDFLADNRHLWLRSRKMSAILKVRSTVFAAIDEYFKREGFYEFHSPIFQSTQSEGGSELFTVDYFGEDIYLAQTWQLPAETAIFGLEKIYTIAPSFRAEKSKTSRHLTEYWHNEMEMAWCEFEDIQNYAEALIKYVTKKVLESNKTELEFLNRDLSKLEVVVKEPFIRMTYDEALKILKEKCDLDVEWGKDLRTLEEEKLTKLYDNFIIVTDYPKEVKAFYMKESPNNPKTVQGCDFLAPDGYGEIIGGSQREEKIEEIERKLREQGEDPKDYEFYLDSRRYGSVPHGGFGMGVERIITWLCGLDNIKDSIPFPRTMIRRYP